MMDDTDMMIVDAVRRGYQTAPQVADAIDKPIALTSRRMRSLTKYGILERTATEGRGYERKPVYYYKVRSVQ